MFEQLVAKILFYAVFHVTNLGDFIAGRVELHHPFDGCTVFHYS